MALIFSIMFVCICIHNSHAQQRFQSVLSVRRASFCKRDSCLNGGICKEVVNQGFLCKCPEDFFGDNCEKLDPCDPSPCAGGSKCQQNPNNKNGFLCKCRNNLVGDRCQIFCPPTACKNGATCSFDPVNQLHCICNPGFTGKFCGERYSACASNPCQNGECTELVDGSHFCQCYEGWMGPNCDRPCRDIYNSCDKWKRDRQCESVRTRTKFFDVNCAHSCQRCVFRNETVTRSPPLPPILEPLAWLVGEWASASNAPARYPVSFGGQRHAHIEVLNIQPAPVTMFGTPSIDFKSTSKSVNTPSDIRYNVGYLTIKEHTDPIQTALMTVSNEGMTTVEKGVVDEDVLLLNMTYMQIHPGLKLNRVPLGGTRLFQKIGNELLMTVKKLERDSSISQFSKKFTKIKDYLL